MAALRDDTHAPSTCRNKDSHWETWLHFCARSKHDPDNFAAAENPTAIDRREEEETMIALLVFAAENPRRVHRSAVRKEGVADDRNTAKHAATVVSTVRERYAKRRCRAIGQRTAEGKSSALFLEYRKALAKKDPEPRPPRQPILAKHMLKLHAVLDLANSREDRAFWCLALSAWLGVRRIGDFLAPREEMRKRWRQRHRTHRARIDIVNLEDGEDLLVIVLKPLKEDPEGKNYQESVFKTGPSSAPLCGGNAWRALLEGDPTAEGQAEDATPVFRNRATGKEFTRDDFLGWVEKRFAAAGLRSFGLATHCFRIGGVTTLAAVGGAAAAGVMGSWEGQAMAVYIHLAREQRVKWMTRMAEATDLSFEELSRPVGRRRR